MKNYGFAIVLGKKSDIEPGIWNNKLYSTSEIVITANFKLAPKMNETVNLKTSTICFI